MTCLKKTDRYGPWRVLLHRIYDFQPQALLSGTDESTARVAFQQNTMYACMAESTLVEPGGRVVASYFPPLIRVVIKTTAVVIRTSPTACP